MISNEILEILKKGLDNKELKSLYANQIVKKTDAQGFIQIKNMWFLYGNQDERGNITFNGPFDDSALIYAIAKIFCKSSLFKSYKFSEKYYNIFLHNHSSSIEEIKEKYPELND